MTTETADVSQVAERLSFFFSNANLRMDKFLRKIVMDTYSGGFCEIDTLLKFNTIKKLTTDPAVIAEAAGTLKHLKLNENKNSIARVEPFTADMLSDNIKVSLRISDIPIKEGGDGSEYANTRDEIGELFKEFGKVAMVRLQTMFDRHTKQRVALGKGFVEFESTEDMEKATAELCVCGDDADAKPKRVLRIGESDLRIKTMQQWLDKKAAKKGTKEVKVGDKRSREEGKENSEIEAIEFKLDWKKGCVVKLQGLSEGADREKIIETAKGVVGDDADVRADYNRGDPNGKIRFGGHSDKIAELASKLNDGSLTIGDSKVESATIMEGEEEEKYYAEYIALRTKQLQRRAEDKLQRRKRSKRRN